MKKVTKKIIKYIMFFVFFILMLINVSFGYFRYSERGQNFLLKEVIAQINKRVNGELTISQMRGNLFNNFTLLGIELKNHNNRELASIGSVNIEWDYKKIFSRNISIANIEIKEVQGEIIRSIEGNINIREVFRTKPGPSRAEKMERKANRPRSRGIGLPYINLNLNITVDNLAIYDAEIDIRFEPENYFIPEKVAFESIEIEFMFIKDYITSNITLENLRTRNNDFTIYYLNTDITMNNEYINILELSIFSEETILMGSARIDYRDLEYAMIDIQLNPFQIEDFRAFIPPQAPLQEMNNLNLDLYINLEDSNALVSIGLVDGEMSLNSLVFLEGYLDFFETRLVNELIDDFDAMTEMDSKQLFNNNYTATIEFKNADALKYMSFVGVNIPHFERLGGDANISVMGKSFNIHEMVVNLEIELLDTVYNELLVDKLILKSTLDKRDVDLSLELYSGETELIADINLIDFLEIQDYNVAINVQSLDLQPFINGLYSDITAEITAVGRHFVPEKMVAELNINTSESFISTEVADAMILVLDVNEGHFILKELLLINDIIEIEATAEATLEELLSSAVKLLVKEPRDIILSYTGFEVDFEALALFEATGRWENLKQNLELTINDIRTEVFHIESIQSNHKMSDTERLQSINQIFISEVELNLGDNENPIIVENLLVEAKTNDREVVIDLFLNSEDLFNLNLSSSLNWSDILDFTIFDISIYNEIFDWSNNEYIHIEIIGDNIKLDNFNLYSIDSPPRTFARGQNRGERNLEESGRVRRREMRTRRERTPMVRSILIESAEKRGEDMFINLDINNVDFSYVLNLLKEEIDIQGIFSLSLVASLEDNELDIYSSAQISQVSYALPEINHTLEVERILLDAYFRDQTLKVSNSILSEGNEIDINLILPITIDINNNDFGFRDDDFFYANLVLEDINLEVLNPFMSPENQIHATLNVDLESSGTLSEPLLIGHIQIDSGNFINTDWGVNFNNIASKIHINPAVNNHIISIEDISFERGLGSFVLQGESVAYLDFSDIEQNSFFIIDNTALDMSISNLTLIDGVLGRTNISGNLRFTDKNVDETVQKNRRLISMPDFALNGRIFINESRINYDEILRLETSAATEPILVTAQRGSDGIVSTRSQAENPFNIPNFDVNVNIEILQNFWVQGRDISLDLTGGATVLVNQNEPFIDAFLEVGRGHYSFFGKRFNLDEGVVTLVGHELDNPLLHIRAFYLFRNQEGVRQRIDLLIEGNLQSPEVSFFLDNEPMDELEAISYIVFGRPLNFLSQNETEAAADFNFTTDILMGQLSTQLTQLLQQQLNVDLIEIRGDNQWQQASLTVGRYFGNNLFVSYEQSFDTNDLRDFGSNVLNVEFKLNRHFYLTTTQSNAYETGIDLIFRWQR